MSDNDAVKVNQTAVEAQPNPFKGNAEQQFIANPKANMDAAIAAVKAEYDALENKWASVGAVNGVTSRGYYDNGEGQPYNDEPNSGQRIRIFPNGAQIITTSLLNPKATADVNGVYASGKAFFNVNSTAEARAAGASSINTYGHSQPVYISGGIVGNVPAATQAITTYTPMAPVREPAFVMADAVNFSYDTTFYAKKPDGEVTTDAQGNKVALHNKDIVKTGQGSDYIIIGDEDAAYPGLGNNTVIVRGKDASVFLQPSANNKIAVLPGASVSVARAEAEIDPLASHSSVGEQVEARYSPRGKHLIVVEPGAELLDVSLLGHVTVVLKDGAKFSGKGGENVTIVNYSDEHPTQEASLPTPSQTPMVNPQAPKKATR